MKSIVKRICTLTLAAAMSVGLLASCGNASTSKSASGSASKKSSGNSKKVDIRIGTQNGSLCLAGFHVALDNGYFADEFKKAGVTWKVEQVDLANVSDLIASDKIDAATQLAGAMIPQIDNGLQIQFTAGMHTGCTKVFTKKGSKIKAIKDLKGKKIGVPSLGDSSVIALKRALFDAGIGVSEDNMQVTFVVYSGNDLPLALENGAVDAAALHDPVGYQAQEQYGFQKILDLTTDPKFKNEYCCMSFVTTKLAKENPKAAAAYTRAILKGCAFVAAEPEEAAKLQIKNKQCSGDLATNTKLLKTYNYSPSVSVASNTIYNAASELIRIGDLKSATPDDFVKKAFVTFDGVPDSYTYKDGKFTEVKKHGDCCTTEKSDGSEK